MKRPRSSSCTICTIAPCGTVSARFPDGSEADIPPELIARSIIVQDAVEAAAEAKTLDLPGDVALGRVRKSTSEEASGTSLGARYEACQVSEGDIVDCYCVPVMFAIQYVGFRTYHVARVIVRFQVLI